jgi:hypothetical protein
MTLAIILGIYVVLATPLAGGALPVAYQDPAQQSPAPQTAPRDTKQQEQGAHQPAPEPKPEEKPVEPQATPSEGQQPAQAPAQPVTPPAQPSEAAPQTPEVKPPQKPAPPKKTKKRKNDHKPSAEKDPKTRRVVVRDGGTSEPSSQLSPGMPQDHAHSRQTTNQLLASTEENLKRTAGRTLTPNQQAMVDQIRAFMTQANAALKIGDLQRGHNLAIKAHLLSDDLLRH